MQSPFKYFKNAVSFAQEDWIGPEGICLVNGRPKTPIINYF